MIHLMKLELKKIHFGRYILIAAFAIVLSMFFIFVSLNDSSDSVRTFEEAKREHCSKAEHIEYNH